MKDDLISRQFMYSLGATCLAKRNDDGELVAITGIRYLPSAQPEIIQCKDCKHYRQYNDQDDLCVYTMTSVEADDYCSYAERREDAERKNNV